MRIKTLRPQTKLIILFLILVMVAFTGVFFIQQQDRWLTESEPRSAQQSDDHSDLQKINILFISNGYEDSLTIRALTLDPHYNSTFNNNTAFLSEHSLDIFDIIIFENVILNSSELNIIKDYLSSGGNIMILMGDAIQDNPQWILDLNIVTNCSGNDDKDGVMVRNEDLDNPIVWNIEWNSIPESKNLTIVEAAENAQILINAKYESDEQYPLLIKDYDSSILLFTLWLDNGGTYNLNQNKQFKNSFYYNYFFYISIIDLINGDKGKTFTPDKYKDWPYSPVPHRTAQIWIGFIEAFLIITGVSAFLYMRKKSKEIPQEKYIEYYKKKLLEQEEELKKKKKKEELEELKRKKEDWEEIGTHRQFSGFLYGLFGSIFLLIPQLILTGYLFTRYIMPYPFIAGIYDNTKQLFMAIWVLFDLGTSVALAKFFAQYRIKQPEKAVRYIQIFIWFQTLTGFVQTTLIGFLGAFYFPETHFVSMSYVFILHSFIQFPGWFLVFIFVFQGMQRTDLQLILNIIQVAIFDLGGKYASIMFFRYIFAPMPQFGDAFGAMVGYAIGQMLGEFFTFLYSIRIYKKLGFHLGTIFRVDFGKDEIMEVLRFGWRYTIGAVLVPLVHMIQAYLLSIWVFNYNAEWGYFSQVYLITQVAAVVNLYSQGMMSGISEAYSHKKYKLTELNIVQGFKISYYVSLFINGILLVILDIFIIGAMGPDWASATRYVPFLIFRALWEPATWLGDKIFQGTGYTREMSISWVIEQGSRLIGLLLFMNPHISTLYLGMYGLLLAWTFSLIAKVIYQIWAIRSIIIKFHVYWWKMFIANFISALITMGLIYGIKVMVERLFGVTPLSAISLFVFAIFVMFPIYSLINGWLGGWDDNTLKEFDRASAMVNVEVRFLARLLYKSTKLGAEHSLMGLHNKYVIDIYEEAREEAKDLTRQKKLMVL